MQVPSKNICLLVGLLAISFAGSSGSKFLNNNEKLDDEIDELMKDYGIEKDQLEGAPSEDEKIKRLNEQSFEKRFIWGSAVSSIINNNFGVNKRQAEVCAYVKASVSDHLIYNLTCGNMSLTEIRYIRTLCRKCDGRIHSRGKRSLGRRYARQSGTGVISNKKGDFYSQSKSVFFQNNKRLLAPLFHYIPKVISSAEASEICAYTKIGFDVHSIDNFTCGRHSREDIKHTMNECKHCDGIKVEDTGDTYAIRSSTLYKGIVCNISSTSGLTPEEIVAYFKHLVPEHTLLEWIKKCPYDLGD